MELNGSAGSWCSNGYGIREASPASKRRWFPKSLIADRRVWDLLSWGIGAQRQWTCRLGLSSRGGLTRWGGLSQSGVRVRALAWCGLVWWCFVALRRLERNPRIRLALLFWVGEKKKQAGGGGRAGSGRSRFPLHNGNGTHECQREERRKRGGERDQDECGLLASFVKVDQ